jgi:putative DNA primase/helicase
VTSKPWDGVSRIGDFHNTVTAANQDSDQKIKRLKETMMTKWLLSAIAAAFEPNGASTAGVLVFTGAQYMGKTKWFKSLTPKSLDVTKDGLSLRPDDRDSVKRAVSYWMVELGELDATFRKADIAALKAFITSDRDVMRLSYGREERTFARRTVFFGSVNDDQFLKDKTGNRRFWTINCQAIDCDHKIDMQQLWAEVYESMYLKGMSWFLSNQEVADLNEHNDNHTEIDPIDERLSFRLDWKTDQSNWRWVTATQMLMECGIDRPTSSDTKTAGVFLRKMNVQKRKSSGKSLVCVPPALKIGQF